MAYPKPTRIASLRNLRFVWNQSRDASGRGGAPGVDWQRPKSFRDDLEKNLERVRREILTGYQFSKLRLHPIDKGHGKQRIICIPTVKDRLVQRLILHHLTFNRDILDVINPISYGFIKGQDKGVREAVLQAIKHRQSYPWVLKTDIAAFFDQINRDQLKEKLREKLRRSSIIPFLDDIIGSEVFVKSRKDEHILKQNEIRRGRGLRQGMPLSPLLSNVVLRGFDKKLNKLDIPVVRYADDLVVFAHSKRKCLEYKIIISQELHKVKLQIPVLEDKGSKTSLSEPGAPVEFLGFEIFSSKGKYNYRIPRYSVDNIMVRIEGHKDVNYLLQEGLNLSSFVQRLTNIQTGYVGSYDGAANHKEFKVELARKIQEVKRHVLESIFTKAVIDRLSDREKRFLGI